MSTLSKLFVVSLFFFTIPAFAGECTGNQWQPTFVRHDSVAPTVHYVEPSRGFTPMRSPQHAQQTCNERGVRETIGGQTCRDREWGGFACGCNITPARNSTCAAFQRFLDRQSSGSNDSGAVTRGEWRFGRADGSVIANAIRLLPDGRIQGYSHRNEHRWGRENGVLVFYGSDGKVTTRFTESTTVNGRRQLRGRFLLRGDITHTLTRISDGVPTSSGVAFTDATWKFGRADGSVIATRIRLLPGGRIEGYSHPNESRWGVEQGVLVFYSRDGKPSTRFTDSTTVDGQRQLRGRLLGGKTVHTLTQVD